MRRTERIPSVVWRANPPKLGFATPWATDAQAQAAFNEMDADELVDSLRRSVSRATAAALDGAVGGGVWSSR